GRFVFRPNGPCQPAPEPRVAPLLQPDDRPALHVAGLDKMAEDHPADIRLVLAHVANRVRLWQRRTTPVLIANLERELPAAQLRSRRRKEVRLRLRPAALRESRQCAPARPGPQVRVVDNLAEVVVVHDWE